MAYFTNRQDVINIQTFEQWPHCEVDIDQTSTEIKSAWEACYNLQASLRGIMFRAGIQTDDLAGSGSWERQDLRDLKCVRLDVLGETGPRKSQVVAHEIIDWVAGDQS